jgi:hypothetical protein
MVGVMEEIAPGIWHWTSKHPRIGVEVSSYLLEPEGVVLDPMVPDEGMEWFAEHGPPTRVVLTNRHHDRDAAEFVAALGVGVHVIREGLHEYEDKDLDVEAFDFGDELPGGLRVHEVGVICPDETAVEIPRANALAIADGAMNYAGGELHFVPDEYIGDDAAAIKAGLREVYARLADELEPEILLIAHGSPVVGGGADALRRFAAG